MLNVAFVVFEGFESMALATVSVFAYANKTAEEPVYDVAFLSEHGGLVHSFSGLTISTQAFDTAAYDTVIVVGVESVDAPVSSDVLAFLRNSRQRSRRTASLCSGALVLARAGLLDGRHVTTHWAFAQALRRGFPEVSVDDDRIFVVDGPIWTSAGATAGIDLVLAMVEQDLGEDVARSLARMLVVYHRRAGGQSQHSALLELQAKSDRIQAALRFARENLAAPLCVERLAEVAHLSPRQFSRAFRTETGQTPAKAIENLRLESARLMMERSRHTVDQVATQTGFGDHRRMRKAFIRAYGQPPQAVRRNARLREPA